MSGQKRALRMAGGCSPVGLADKGVPPKEGGPCGPFVEFFQLGDFEGLKKELPPQKNLGARRSWEKFFRRLLKVGAKNVPKGLRF